MGVKKKFGIYYRREKIVHIIFPTRNEIKTCNQNQFFFGY